MVTTYWRLFQSRLAGHNNAPVLSWLDPLPAFMFQGMWGLILCPLGVIQSMMALFIPFESLALALLAPFWIWKFVTSPWILNGNKESLTNSAMSMMSISKLSMRRVWRPGTILKSFLNTWYSLWSLRNMLSWSAESHDVLTVQKVLLEFCPCHFPSGQGRLLSMSGYYRTCAQCDRSVCHDVPMGPALFWGRIGLKNKGGECMTHGRLFEPSSKALVITWVLLCRLGMELLGVRSDISEEDMSARNAIRMIHLCFTLYALWNGRQENSLKEKIGCKKICLRGLNVRKPLKGKGCWTDVILHSCLPLWWMNRAVHHIRLLVHHWMREEEARMAGVPPWQCCDQSSSQW